ncbi:carbonyl reductase 1 [Trypanosoma rangeli]|uniref:Carbonyl reductase 1 n=1 Tax=Trypanosoma rangeli TaxID=5698 RepID=A0A3R7KI53_TRYRA|nr:carbonyl reductase 1 [Trypanosoma rangeli]RNF08116.1 carbonyl reductase 1 [Trypanosoma rangeli]|eukprot:RNF08116.1 carbonyl reductase 1 [Trypanosoma rangeli]
MNSSVACITGANRGIGFEIAKKLAMQGFTIIMACRNETFAKAAELELKEAVEGVQIVHVCIDLAATETAKSAALKVGEMFPGGIDLMINNAGFAYHWDAQESFYQQAMDTIRINYYGTVAVCEAILPHIKSGGRMITVSSMSGSLLNLSTEKLISRWKECGSKKDIDSLLQEFIDLTKGDGKHLVAGWPNSAYGVSKLAVTTYTRILGRSASGIHIFSCCPGSCRTKMSTFTGLKTAEEGADTPVWLAVSQEALQTVPQGGFATERQYKREEDARN